MKRRIRRSKEESQRLILDAASELVRANGPDALRISEVAKKVGMHQTNVLHHFKTKDGLLKALVNRAIEDGAERVAKVLEASTKVAEEDRKEAFAQVFDEVQRYGVGKLYGWLILGGYMKEPMYSNVDVLLPAIQEWRAAMFGDRLQGVQEDDLRPVLLLLAVIWLGESIGGDFMALMLGYENPAKARHEFHRWLSRIIFGWLEHEASLAEAPPS